MVVSLNTHVRSIRLSSLRHLLTVNTCKQENSSVFQSYNLSIIRPKKNLIISLILLIRSWINSFMFYDYSFILRFSILNFKLRVDVESHTCNKARANFSLKKWPRLFESFLWINSVTHLLFLQRKLNNIEYLLF